MYGGIFYLVLLGGAALAGLCTVIGKFAETRNIRLPVIRQISWLMIMSIAYAAGTLKFIFKTDKAMWIPATRPAITDISFSMKEGLSKK